MEAWITRINDAVYSVVWGPFMLVLMLGVGILLTFRTGFFQVAKWKAVLRSTLLPKRTKAPAGKEKSDGKSISSFQAAATALAGCLGTGNIVGVATTLVSGGPGALFWMWVSAFFGMMTKYAENVLAVHFRQKNKAGETVGGPMYYIEKGMHSKWLAVVFAVCCTAASFGIGNMTQVNSISTSFQTFSDVSGLTVGIVVAVIAGFVLIGGIKRIAGFSAAIVPIFAVFYTAGALVILVLNYKEIPAAFSLIFRDAFNMQSVGGGVLGYACMKAVRFGIARGVFSNEAGLGSGSIAHAAAEGGNAVKEGMWGIFEVFFDTIVMCTITGLVILTTGVFGSGADGAALTSAAFGSVFGARIADIFLAVSISFFAFAAIIGWSYFGEQCVAYLFRGKAAVMVYKLLFLGCIVLGATMELKLVWSISDSLNGAMAIPNLIAIICLNGIVVRLTRDSRKKKKSSARQIQ